MWVVHSNKIVKVLNKVKIHINKKSYDNALYYFCIIKETIMPTIDYNGIPMEQQTETNYNYNVGGEVKKTVPFTKELREWLLMFKSRGIRFADTIDELRLFTKHENKQMFGVIENGSIYQYQLVTTTDDGENAIKPDNVYSYNTGRWIKVLSFSNEIVNLWSQMQYTGVWGTNPSPISATDTTFYIDNANGIDNSTIDGTMAHPFKTIAYAINRFGVVNHYWNGKLTLNLIADYTETISILNYFNSNLVINAGAYNISEIEMYGNGNITLSGDGEIGELRSTLNNNIYVGGFTFNPSPVNRAFIDDYNVTLDGCFVRGIITVQDCNGTVKLGNLTIYPTFYVDLLRCKAHVSAIDGDIQANYCFITRALAPYITGTHNVITDMQPLSNVVYVNYDFVVDYPDGRIFKSYQDAVTWIQGNAGVLSDANTWTIVLPSGLITEIITKYQFIELQASVGTVINELKSGIDYTILVSYMFCKVGNFTINKITLENGKGINLSNCEVFDIECDTDGFFVSFNSFIFGNCDFDNISHVTFYNTFFTNNSTIDNFHKATFKDCYCEALITVKNGQTVYFVNSLVIEAVINSGGIINNINTYFENLTDNGSYNVLNKLTNSDVSQTEYNAGCTRYIEEANSSKYQMIMKTGASTWEWVTIKENTW